MPTDTVYGLAARADDGDAIRNLFRVKGRPDDNPLPILLPDPEAIHRAASHVPAAAVVLAARFWPGPLTIVVPKSEAVSDLVSASRPTVGVRMPDHPVALALLSACDFLVAVTSANLSGQPPAQEAQEVQEVLGDRLDAILWAERCPGGVPSTVVDVSGPTVRVLRPGPITMEDIEAALKAI